MRRQIDEETGRLVEELLKARGLTYRGADHKTGVNYNTISRMAMGYTPEMESVVKFATGLGLDVNQWLERYGYEPLERTGSEVLVEGIAALQQELGKPLMLGFKLKPNLSVDDAESILADLREQSKTK